MSWFTEIRETLCTTVWKGWYQQQCHYDNKMDRMCMESTVFIQPESEISCLNKTPQLGLKLVQPNGLSLGAQPVQIEAGQAERVSNVNVINSTYIPNSNPFSGL